MSALSKFNVQVFGASVDPVEANTAFSQKGMYNFPLLSDPEKSFARGLGVLNPANGFTHRWTYVIDDQGVIREIDKMVNARSHGKDLAAKLETLGAPKKEAAK